MNAALVRALLAVLALLLAVAGQYYLEYRDELAQGLYLLVAGGAALAAAYVRGPSPFPSTPLEVGSRTTATEEGRSPRAARVLIALALALIGLSLHRSASNPDDGIAWLLHLAGIVCFLALFVRIPMSAILTMPRPVLPRPSRAMLVEGTLLLAVLALALFLRLLMLDELPFGPWYDEAIHGMAAVRVLEDSSYRPIFVPEANVASAMIFLQVGSIWLLGRSTVALRLPSVLMDLGLILLLYLLARRLLGARAALVVAFLVAVSSWDITWARNAMPGVTTPLFAVAVVLTFLWAIRRNSVAAFAKAGVVLGFSAWYYQSVRVMPVAILLLVAYLSFQARPDVRPVARRFGVYVAGALLVAAPLLLYSVTHVTEFWKRAYVVTSSETGSSLDAFSFIRANVDEYLLMFSYSGDVNGRHGLPDEPMLAFGVAALAALGLLFCLTRPHRPVPFLLLVWLIFALLPGLVTVPFEAPNTLRAIGSLPVAYLFAGVGVLALWRAVAPAIPRYAGVVLGVPLIAGMAAVAYDGYNTYFHLQRNDFDVWSSFNPVQTAIAYRLQDLPSRHYDVQIAPFLAPYPVITFLVPEGPRIETFISARHPPASVASDGALMFLDTGQEPYLDRIESYYPQGSYSMMDFGFGPKQPIVYTVELDAEDITGPQGLTARLTPLEGSSQTPEEVRVSRVDLPWGDAPAPAPPFLAEWEGVLYVPEFGDYWLVVEGSPEARLLLDGAPVLERAGDVMLSLAQGSHALLLTDLVTSTEGRTRLLWMPPRGRLTDVGTGNLYTGVAAHGLLGSYLPPDYPEASGAFQRIDPMPFFFFFHHRPFLGEFRILWEGELE